MRKRHKFVGRERDFREEGGGVGEKEKMINGWRLGFYGRIGDVSRRNEEIGRV
jgi:hypothetical protein